MPKRVTDRPKQPGKFGHIRDLIPDPQNARKHGPRNVGTIVSALQEVGAARSIVIDEEGVVLAGNATLEAAGEAGITKLQVVDVDGETIVAVRRKNLSPGQKARLALFDNRAAELADGWNVGVLEALQAAGVKLDDMWSEEELAALLSGDEARAGLTDPDNVPDVRATDIQPGQMFEFGRHRLLCGDSTSAADVVAVLRGAKPQLMVTDPPYGVSYDPEWRKRAGVNNSDRMGKVTNDDRADWTPVWDLFPGDVAYVWHGGVAGAEVQNSLLAAKFQVRAQIIWRKPRIVLSRGHYHWQHEPCFYAVRKGGTGHWGGKRNQSTVWTVSPTVHRCGSCGSVEIESEQVPSTVWDIEQRDTTGDTTHGAQKPVECMARAMRNHNAPEVFEPFSGSGSSLIAAEMLARACYAIEIDPSYVQQAIDRWEAFTGQKAVKVGDAIPA